MRLRSPSILIEVLIQDAFNQLMKGRTSFIIAQCLSTIQNADMILVMVDGDIVEHGTHEELMQAQGVYYKMQTVSKQQIEVRMKRERAVKSVIR